MLKGCCCFDLKTGGLYAVLVNLLFYAFKIADIALNMDENFLKPILVIGAIGWVVNIFLLAGIAKVSQQQLWMVISRLMKIYFSRLDPVLFCYG